MAQGEWEGIFARLGAAGDTQEEVEEYVNSTLDRYHRPDPDGPLTPLIVAIKQRNLDTVQVLLAAGADPREPSNNNMLPMGFCVLDQWIPGMMELLEHGVAPYMHVKKKDRSVLFHVFSECRHHDPLWSAMALVVLSTDCSARQAVSRVMRKGCFRCIRLLAACGYDLMRVEFYPTQEAVAFAATEMSLYKKSRRFVITLKTQSARRLGKKTRLALRRDPTIPHGIRKLVTYPRREYIVESLI